uniref:bL25m n=1 Tax=Polytomella magna TaxID=353565 RepID=UPI002240E386|nr:Chain At, bL25m [Polytomella magna]8APN_At Chain At, bL25m [Polytomella magna]8APO_At Chain At, bL25m [Polytomella magna]
QVVPSEIIRPLESINSFLEVKSNISGRIRYELYSSELKFSFPKHDIEEGLLELTAYARTKTKKSRAKYLREDGNIPTVIHGFDKATCGFHNLNLCIPEKEANAMVRKYGRNGCAARVVKVKVVDHANPEKVFGYLRTRPCSLAITATSLKLELMHLQYCPQDRLVDVRVPIRLINDDVAPGVKKGGWISVKQRLVGYQCRGNSIPPHIEVDAKHLRLDDKVLKRDLPIPKGTRLLGCDFDAVVLHCTTDVGKE